MDDIIVIDDFLTQEELMKITSLSTYKNETWNIHKSWHDSHKHPLKDIDFNTSFLSK